MKFYPMSKECPECGGPSVLTGRNNPHLFQVNRDRILYICRNCSKEEELSIERYLSRPDCYGIFVEQPIEVVPTKHLLTRKYILKKRVFADLYSSSEREYSESIQEIRRIALELRRRKQNELNPSN